MPIVSVNLSAAAYEIWASMPKGRRSARVSYLILRNYTVNPNLSKGERVAPILEEGDVRIMNNGEQCVWTSEGWKVIGEEEPDPPEKLEEKPPQKSAMEQWADIQKGIYDVKFGGEEE